MMGAPIAIAGIISHGETVWSRMLMGPCPSSGWARLRMAISTAMKATVIPVHLNQLLRDVFCRLR